MKTIKILLLLLVNIALFANTATQKIGEGHVTVIQENANMVWYGTLENGLCQWDKNTQNTTCFTTDNSILTDNKIKDIFFDNVDDLWISTDSSLFKINDGNLELVDANKAGLFAQKSNGELIAVDNYFLHTYNGSTWSTLDLTQVVSDFCCSTNDAVGIDDNDNIWIAHHDFYFYTVLRFDGTNWTAFVHEQSLNAEGPLATSEASILPRESFDDNALFIDDNNIVWASSWTGLYQYQNNEWNIIHGAGSLGNSNDTFFIEDGQDTLQHFVYNITQDLTGNIWLSTGQDFNKNFEELAYFDGTNWEIMTQVFPNGTVLEDMEASLFDEDIIYTATNDGLYILRTDIVIETSQLERTTWMNYTDGKRIMAMDETLDDLWIATTGGLCRYNKTTQISTFFNRGNSDIPSNNLTDVVVANDGNIWVATDLGAAYFDGNNWTNFYDIKSAKITQGINNDIWLAADQLYHYDNGMINNHLYPNSSELGPISNGIDINKNTGEVWLSVYQQDAFFTYLNVMKFDGVNWTVYNHLNTPLPTYPEVYTPYIYGDLLVQNEMIWAVCSNGIFRLHLVDETWSIFDTTNTTLSSHHIASIEEDMNNELWFGIQSGYNKHGGVAHFDGTTWQEYQHPDNNILSKYTNYVYPSKLDNDTYYFGTYGEGLYQSDLNDWSFINTSNSPLHSNDIFTLTINNENLWMTTDGNVLHNQIHGFNGQTWTTEDTSQTNIDWENYLYVISDQNSETAWIRVHGGNQQQLYFFQDGDWQLFDLAATNPPSEITGYFDAKVQHDIIWIEKDGQLFRYKDNTWTSYTPPSYVISFGSNGSSNYLMTHNFSDISTYVSGTWTTWTSEDYGLANGKFHKVIFGGYWNWILHDYGIIRQNYSTGSFYVTPLDYPLLEQEYLLTFALDKHNNFWIGTSKRLLYFDAQMNTWTIYDTSNSNLPNGGIKHLVFDEQDNLWIGTDKGGLSVFNPQGIENITPQEQKVAFHLFLEGAYQTNGTMSTALQEANLLPLTQPYNQAPYFYDGNEAVTTMPDGVVDWVLVEARLGTPQASGERNTVTVETHAALLIEDGTLMDTDGTIGVTFRCLQPNAAYYFCIRHHNHLDVISSNPINPSQTPLYDFTTDENQALGNNQLKESDDSRYMLFTGDYTQDGVIQVSDYDAWITNPAILNIYAPTDGTLDGVIQVTDFDAWFNNKAKLGVPEIDY